MRIPPVLLLIAVFFSACSTTPEAVVFVNQGAAPLERLAALELQRYVYHRTGTLPDIAHQLPSRTDAQMFVVGSIGDLSQTVDAGLQAADTLGPQEFVLREGPAGAQLIVGGSPLGTLYGVYRYVETLGVGFYLEGDVIPDKQIAYPLPTTTEVGSPLFETRGILPFHDFPEGPDWWNPDDYKAILAQLPKLRMNFIGLHTYPERSDFNGEGPKAEPLVWIGPEEDINPDGTVKTGYPVLHFHTGDSTWGYAPAKTSEFGFGAAELFETDDYGADYMKGLSPWPHTDAENIRLFNDVGALMHDAFGFAQKLGVKTAVGTEVALTVPNQVQERLAGEDISDRETRKRLYRGMFERIKRTHPLDYYWFWTPENWTWGTPDAEEIQNVEEDLQIAVEAAAEVEAPFTLATNGWVLGPPGDRAGFDRMLPKEMPFSCINREVGFSLVEPSFKEISGRPKWAIPWMEDDPALISPQFWVGRMRRDAADALDYGCDGLLGIHWRTSVLGPNVSALAQAGWAQDSRRDEVAPPGGRDLSPDDYYQQWARTNFGDEIAEDVARIFIGLDGGPHFRAGENSRSANLPRGSDWVQGPGAVRLGTDENGKTFRSQEDLDQAFAFVHELRPLDQRIESLGNKRRFGYWFSTLQFAQWTNQLALTLRDLNQAADSLAEMSVEADRIAFARSKLLDLRESASSHWQLMMNSLLESVQTTGDLGTIANLEQHNLRKLNLLARHDSLLVSILGEEEVLPYTELRDSGERPWRLIATTNRSILEPDEDFRLRFRVLHLRPKTELVFNWRPIGPGSFKKITPQHLARGVFEITIPAAEIGGESFEYYLFGGAGDERDYLPATAPDICRSVVVMPQ